MSQLRCGCRWSVYHLQPLMLETIRQLEADQRDAALSVATVMQDTSSVRHCDDALTGGALRIWSVRPARTETLDWPSGRHLALLQFTSKYAAAWGHLRSPEVRTMFGFEQIRFLGTLWCHFLFLLSAVSKDHEEFILRMFKFEDCGHAHSHTTSQIRDDPRFRAMRSQQNNWVKSELRHLKSRGGWRGEGDKSSLLRKMMMMMMMKSPVNMQVPELQKVLCGLQHETFPEEKQKSSWFYSFHSQNKSSVCVCVWNTLCSVFRVCESVWC